MNLDDVLKLATSSGEAGWAEMTGTLYKFDDAECYIPNGDKFKPSFAIKRKLVDQETFIKHFEQ